MRHVLYNLALISDDLEFLLTASQTFDKDNKDLLSQTDAGKRRAKHFLIKHGGEKL